MDDNLVIIKQLPIIEERLNTLKSKIEEKTKNIISLPCTEGTVKDIKKIRAEFNKEFNELEARRKSVKAQIEAPYMEFNSIYEECVTTPFMIADNVLKTKINGVEEKLKHQKKEKIIAYAKELKSAYDLDWLDVEMIMPKVTISESLSSLKSTIAEKLDRISVDCKCISENSDTSAEVLAEYKKTFNLAQSNLIVSQRKKEIAIAISDIQNKSEHQQFKQECEQKVEMLAPPIEVKQEKIYKMIFTVQGTTAQLKELKKFMNERGIKYE